jgi:hypothetical protein
MKKSHSQGSDGSLLGLETFQQAMLCQFEDLPNGDETIPNNDQERRFVWEHLNNVHRILYCLHCAGTTVSASKLFIAIPKVIILGHRYTTKAASPMTPTQVESLLEIISSVEAEAPIREQAGSENAREEE